MPACLALLLFLYRPVSLLLAERLHAAAAGRVRFSPVHVDQGTPPWNRPDTAFVLLGVGAYARQLKCEATLESLRRWVAS